MIAYLDTNVVLWSAEAALHRITPAAQQILQRASLLVSPAVFLELQYLFEIGRIAFSSADIFTKLSQAFSVEVCDLPFPRVVEAALSEGWTRDPFDRLIVAQAKAKGFATLVTADRKIRESYSGALW